ncbi:MAG: hypothetical protein ABI405_12265 [Parafilimonas sp.]
MKRNLFLSVLLIISSSVFSQDLTGIWRGSFYAGVAPFQQYYKYEVQIDQSKNYSLQGVTYSYHTTVFYGKATFTGIWFPKAKSALVKELKLIELKVADNSDACAMTCNLDYSKQDGKEILSGSFTSVNANNNSDCGGGTVYLERVQESAFHKEDFLLNKQKPAPAPAVQNNVKPKVAAPVINDVSKTNIKKLQSALGVPADGMAGPKTMAALKKKLPDFNDKLDANNADQINKLIADIKRSNSTIAKKTQLAKPSVQNKTKPPVVVKNDTIAKAIPPLPSDQNQITVLPPKKIIPVPDVIKTRSNPLIKTITTNFPDITVELYDNGDIDGDTITVYDNNQVIAWKKGLTDKPIIINIKADAETPVHEFVMVADNLGAIPPNTALMVITTGGKRYQVFISSDKQKNAKVIIQYNAPQE